MKTFKERSWQRKMQLVKEMRKVDRNTSKEIGEGKCLSLYVRLDANEGEKVFTG